MSLIDDVVNEVDSNNPRKKKKGDRPMFWIGFKDSKVVKVQASSKEEAEKQLDSLSFDRPFYIVRGYDKLKSSSISITLNAKDVRYTGNTYTGVFQGWRFIANGLRELEVDGKMFNDNELIIPQFDSPVDPSSKTPKPSLKRNMAIKVSDAENVKLLD